MGCGNNATISNRDIKNENGMTMNQFKDYLISKKKADVDRSFNEIDTDKNGSISFEEYKSFNKDKSADDIKKEFDSIDTNHNGEIDKKEFLQS